jgi:hypothetical protein
LIDEKQPSISFSSEFWLSEIGFKGAIAPVKMKGQSWHEVKPMAINQLRYSKEEFARRGNEIYESQVRSQVEEGNHGKIVAIDIETGAFELAKNTMTASDRLLEQYPDAQIWCIRIGHKGVHRFGVGRLL